MAVKVTDITEIADEETTNIDIVIDFSSQFMYMMMLAIYVNIFPMNNIYMNNE